ncbi:MAG: baseplate J/gp47 family protein, partial [Candidatus Kerfeldbacteria bacterium]|nr:baseplate J/gp47 family protein [Candidatus Kerfeldbacteria bacterium]
MAELRQAQLQRMYRFVILGFVVLVLGVSAGVGYAAWSKTTVTITPRRVPLTADFSVTVAAASSEATTLVGTVASETKSATVTVTPEQQGTPIPAHATGQVILTNTTAKDQPLAAGTRLKADNGVIVRTNSRVDVPAGGTVKATVTADLLGEEGNLPAGHFIIVALWPGLQDKIYADSEVAFSGGLASGGATLAVADLTAASDRAQADIVKTLPANRPGTIVVTAPESVTTNPTASTPSTSYEVTVKLKVVTVTYSANELSTLIGQQLRSSLADDQELSSVDEPRVTLGEQPSADSVILDVTALGQATIAKNSPRIARSAFVGKSAQEISSQLLGTDVVKSVVISFSPWWRTTAPERADRIVVVLT